jgi:hypothetical protein
MQPITTTFPVLGSARCMTRFFGLGSVAATIQQQDFLFDDLFPDTKLLTRLRADYTNAG